MDINPYKSFGPLQFWVTSREQCVHLLGNPDQIRTNSEGAEELHYAKCIIRLDQSTRRVRECTLLPHADGAVDGIKVTWDMEFMRRVCERDGAPMDAYGFIIMNRLGIAVTGLHDDDDSQIAITAYSRGDVDDLLADSVPFECSTAQE